MTDRGRGDSPAPVTYSAILCVLMQHPVDLLLRDAGILGGKSGSGGSGHALRQIRFHHTAGILRRKRRIFGRPSITSTNSPCARWAS